MHSATPRNDRQAPSLEQLHPAIAAALAPFVPPPLEAAEAIAALRGLRTRLLARKASAAKLVELAERKREQHQAEVDELARQIDDVDESLFEHGAAPEATPFESGRRTA